MKKGKCILLYSGGLDSILAAKILLDQGIEVTGLHCILPYFPPDMDHEQLKESIAAKQIGLNLIHYRCGEEYISMLKNPPHGYLSLACDSRPIPLSRAAPKKPFTPVSASRSNTCACW